MGCHQQQNATVALQFQVDAGGNPIQNTGGNPIPKMEDFIQEVSNLFNIWLNLNKMEVVKSCQIFHQHAENTDCQNLAWSSELLINDVDTMLQQHILSACENLPECVLSVLFAFVVMAECVMLATQNLAHNINGGLLVMSLCNFEGEDVVKCVFIFATSCVSSTVAFPVLIRRRHC